MDNRNLIIGIVCAVAVVLAAVVIYRQVAMPPPQPTVNVPTQTLGGNTPPDVGDAPGQLVPGQAGQAPPGSTTGAPAGGVTLPGGKNR